jgi:hypothetical protein
MGQAERPKWAGAHESKLGDERVSNPGIISGRCLQCGLLAMEIAIWRTNREGAKVFTRDLHRQVVLTIKVENFSRLANHEPIDECA